MTDIRLSVGTRLYAATTAPATYDMAGFGSLVYTEIGEIGSFGDFGGTAQVTTFIPVSTGIVKKRKGSIDYGQLSLTIGRVSGEAGQGLLKDAFDGSRRFDVLSFKMVNGDGAIAYFTGVVSGFVFVTGDADAVTSINTTIDLDNKVISDVFEFVTLTYQAGANGVVIGPTTQTVLIGGDGAPVFASANAGYVFEDWSDEETDNPRRDLDVSAPFTVTANFVLDE